MSEATPISWRAVVYGTHVIAADGTSIGTVREVLGSDAEDIFHGIRVAHGGGPGNDAVVAADRITGMTTDAVATDLGPGEAGRMPRYDETATYHLASVGWLRKHLGWSRDAGTDEDPG